MVGTIVQRDDNVHNRITGQNASLHCALNTGIDRGDIFLRNRTANDLIAEFVALAGLVRIHLDLAVAVLTFTARLTGVLLVHFDMLADGLFVSNLGLTDICLHLKLAQQTVDDDLQVKLTHTGDDRLSGFLIGVGAESRILFGQLRQADAHLFLTSLGLGLYGDADNRLGEFHGLEDDRMLGIAQRIAGGGVLEANRRRDIAGVAGFNILSVVRMHLQDTAHTLIVIFYRVVNSSTSVDRTGVNAEEAQFAHIRVGCDLESKRSKRLVVGGGTLLLFLGIRVNTLDVGDVHRGGHEVHNRIQQGLHALVFIGSTAADGNHSVGNGRFANRTLDLLYGEFLALQVLLHQGLVGLSDMLDQLGVVFLRQLQHVFGDLFLADIFAQIVVVYFRFHLNEVNNASKESFRANRQLNGNGVALQTIVHHIQHAVKIRAHDVHLVDVRHSGNAILISLSPNCFRLRLNTTLGAENRHRTVEHAERTLNLHCEVHMSRGIDDVDSMAFPVASRSSGSDGDTSLLLLRHPVHCS